MTLALRSRDFELPLIVLGSLAAITYYFSNPEPALIYDQTFRIARAMLHGEIGLREPAAWLELVPGTVLHYSVFPLGAVLTMLPLALLSAAGLITTQPSAALAAITAALLAYYTYRLTELYSNTLARRIAMPVLVIFGSWGWCNSVFGGAWQIALAWALVGEMAAIYYIMAPRRIFLAGFFFALAWGNRIELVLLAPIFTFMILKSSAHRWNTKQSIHELLRFGSWSLLLGVGTMLYNYARFHSLIDMGYERIPYVWDQAGFESGLLSLSSVRMNFETMLTVPWRHIDRFPYFIPQAFGQSILLISPWILLTLRFPKHAWSNWLIAWCAVIVLTSALWVHGNPGGFQCGYRYGMILIPWFTLLILESNRRASLSFVEYALLGISIVLNVYMVICFYWLKNVI